jgi:hypothetical protein
MPRGVLAAVPIDPYRLPGPNRSWLRHVVPADLLSAGASVPAPQLSLRVSTAQAMRADSFAMATVVTRAGLRL